MDFGADSGDAEMLRRLGRDFGPDDLLAAARTCREAGITVMFDLQRAIEYGEGALRIAESIRDLRLEVVTNAYLGIAYYRWKRWL